MTVEEVVDIARKRERHAGTYNNAIKKTEGQLKRSIESYSGEVSERAKKSIQNYMIVDRAKKQKQKKWSYYIKK